MGDLDAATPTRSESQTSQELPVFSLVAAGMTLSILCSDMRPDEFTRNVENPSIKTLHKRNLS